MCLHIISYSVCRGLSFRGVQRTYLVNSTVLKPWNRHAHSQARRRFTSRLQMWASISAREPLGRTQLDAVPLGGRCAWFRGCFAGLVLRIVSQPVRGRCSWGWFGVDDLAGGMC